MFLLNSQEMRRKKLKIKHRLGFFPTPEQSLEASKAVHPAHIIAQHFTMRDHSVVVGPLSPSKDMSVFRWTVKIAHLFPHRKVITSVWRYKGKHHISREELPGHHRLPCVALCHFPLGNYLSSVERCLGEMVHQGFLPISWVGKCHRTPARPIWPT